MHLQHDANGDFFVCPEQILPHMDSDSVSYGVSDGSSVPQWRFLARKILLSILAATPGIRLPSRKGSLKHWRIGKTSCWACLASVREKHPPCTMRKNLSVATRHKLKTRGARKRPRKSARRRTKAQKHACFHVLSPFIAFPPMTWHHNGKWSITKHTLQAIEIPGSYMYACTLLPFNLLFTSGSPRLSMSWVVPIIMCIACPVPMQTACTLRH